MYQQAQGIAVVMIPLLTKLAVHSHYGLIRKRGKENSFLPFLVDFFHGECLLSPLFFLNYFLLYLFVLSLNRKV